MSEYNGWSNYETWNVKLWLDNEQGASEEMRDMARRAKSESDLAKQIEAFVDEFKPDLLDASMFSDLLNAALGEVDWDEIAASYYEEEHEDDEPEEEGGN